MYTHKNLQNVKYRGFTRPSTKLELQAQFLTNNIVQEESDVHPTPKNEYVKEIARHPLWHKLKVLGTTLIKTKQGQLFYWLKTLPLL